MFNSSVIDVAIGLVFIFLLLSLICSAAHELIEMFLKERAANLEEGIRELAGKNSQEFVSRLYDHGLINSLYRGAYAPAARGFFRRLKQRYVKGPDLPSYIPSKNFALALMDLNNKAPEILPKNVNDALRSFESVAGEDLALMQLHIEDWFNSSMDRVSGWYKRRSQWLVLVLGLIAAIAVNADCIEIAKRLSTDTSLRQSVISMAETAAKNNPANDTRPPLDRIKGDLASLDGVGLPLGWTRFPQSFAEVWGLASLHWAGWLITALAISLGAPFWFDILNKIIVVRSTVKPSEKSQPEKSKDPTPPPAPDAPGAS